MDSAPDATYQVTFQNPDSRTPLRDVLPPGIRDPAGFLQA